MLVRDPLGDGTPIIKILQHLKNDGWSVGTEGKHHIATDKKRTFGTCQFTQRRYYLQCLCVLAQLHARGLARIPVGLSAAYYHCLLHADNPAEVPLKGKVMDYNAICDTSTTRGMKQYIAPRRSDLDSESDAADAGHCNDVDQYA